MDPVASLGLGTVPETAAPASMTGLGGLDGDAFMQLLVTQLRYQDPLAPTDTNGLLQQTSMLAQTEMLTQVSKMQQQLLGLQRATMATDLIGVEVEGLAADGTSVAGVVDGVRFGSTGPLLVIGDTTLALDDATSIGGGGDPSVPPAAPGVVTATTGRTASTASAPVGTTPTATTAAGTDPSASSAPGTASAVP